MHTKYNISIYRDINKTISIVKINAVYNRYEYIIIIILNLKDNIAILENNCDFFPLYIV